MKLLEIILLLLVLLTVYSYIIYPILLYILALVYRRNIHHGTYYPHVSIIISVFNEERVIREKLLNTLAIDYPPDKLEILVVSDSSSDSTDNIVRSFKEDNIKLLTFNHRRGKTACLNDAVEKSTGDVLIFSDADAIYPKNIIKNCLSVLHDENVGLVTGSTIYQSSGSDDMAGTSSIYTNLEKLTKILESRIGSCIGADGAIFGMKKILYRPLNNDDINDLVIPLNVIQQGFRVVLADNIYCYEQASVDEEAEYRRQIRITNRTLLALFRYRSMMNVFRYPLIGFEIISHKIVRFCIPFFLLLLIPVNMALFNSGYIYILILLCQLLFYLVGVICFLTAKCRKIKLIRIIYHFIKIQIAILFGWYAFIFGKKQIIWNPGN